MAAETIRLDPGDGYASAEELLPLVAERLHRIGARRIRLGPTSLSFEGGVLRERPDARLAAQLDRGRVFAVPDDDRLRWELGYEGRRDRALRALVGQVLFVLVLVLAFVAPEHRSWDEMWPWATLYVAGVTTVYGIHLANQRLARRLFTIWLERCVEQFGARLAQPGRSG